MKTIKRLFKNDKPVILISKSNNKFNHKLSQYVYNKLENYYIQLDEFSIQYIDEVIALYNKMTENGDYTTIYINLPNIIDYTTHEQDFKKLDSILQDVYTHKLNYKIIIHYDIVTEPEKDIWSDFQDSIPNEIQQACDIIKNIKSMKGGE